MVAETPPLLVIDFLHRAVAIFSDYFGTKATEEELKKNFVVVYEARLDPHPGEGFLDLTK